MTPTDDELERQFERLLRDPLTRRRLMQRGAAGALSVSALAYLAACGTDEPAGGGGEGSSTEQKAIAKGEIADSLYVANWPLYIDEDRGTLKEFEKEYGAKVKYVEEINDNTEFFGKVRQQYDRGDSGGRDIHVVTDWMAARMMRLGYVQKFDKSHDAERRQEPDRRASSRRRSTPSASSSMPWQSGMAGIIYRKDKVKSEPKSVDDAVRPGLQGQGHDAHRDARHGRRGGGLDGRRSREGVGRRVHGGDRQDRRGRRSPARSAASPATSTRRTSRRATPG